MAGIGSVLKGVQMTRDEIGGSPEILPIPIPVIEKVNVMELPVVVKTRGIGTAYTVGHQGANGIFGVSGTHNFIGTAGLGSFSVEGVVNQQNTWVEPLRNTTFIDTTYTTCTADVANHLLDFAASKEFRTLSIFDNNQTVYKCSVIVNTDYVVGTANLSYSASADGGGTWESVVPNVEHAFTVTGNDLRLKITSGAGTARISTDSSSGTTVPLRVQYVTT